MKKVIIAAAIALSGLAFSPAAKAQLHLSIGLNIGSQPDWGPVGYDQASYYYLPDIDTYYDVNSHQFVYFNGGQWIYANTLPSRYGNFDLYNSYKVVINDRTPWMHANVYRSRYASFRGRHDQGLIRDSHDARYRNHWTGNNGRGNSFGNGRGPGNGFGNGHDRGNGIGNRAGNAQGNYNRPNGNFNNGQGNRQGGNWQGGNRPGNNGQGGGNRGNGQVGQQGGNRGNGQQGGNRGNGDRHP